MNIITLSGSTNTSGDLTISSNTWVSGYIDRISYDYIDGTSSADFTFTCEGMTSQPVLSLVNVAAADDQYYVRAPCINTTGGAIQYSYDRLFVNGYMKVVVAQGGDTKGYRFYIYRF